MDGGSSSLSSRPAGMKPELTQENMRRNEIAGAMPASWTMIRASPSSKTNYEHGMANVTECDKYRGRLKGRFASLDFYLPPWNPTVHSWKIQTRGYARNQASAHDECVMA